ncbi:hypothetical protein [Rubrobacter aplysinae]|uniref:hypothetical protein n=1 Tax=Rubrobacter aplysinae TaxID=909625 RepID=UPI00064B9D16|nr:hypothetical protein [Rubrobacter aplysinae]
MGLLRTILALIVLLILAHAGLAYLGYAPDTNQVTNAVFGLARLLEIPAQMLLPARAFYTQVLAAAGGYFVIYILLGIGSRG